MIIPKPIKDEAEARGWRGVRFVGESYGSAFFAETPVIDADGRVLPTGLPEVLVLDGSNVMHSYGEEALILLRLFNHP